MSYTTLRKSLAESLATAYQMPEGDIAKILPENEDDFNESEFKNSFLDQDKQRITTIKEKGKEKFEQGYAKAKKEERMAFENEIKQEFGIEDDELIGIDLMKKVVEANSKNGKVDLTKLSDEDIKKHPAVISMLTEREKQFKTQKKELEDEFNTKLQTINKERTFNQVSKKALDILDGMNPILSEDPQRASNQKNILIRELQRYDFQQEGDEFIPLEDGKRIEDAHGNGLTYDQLIKREAEKYFDFKKADPRQTPPSGDGDDPKPINAPKTEAEYAKLISDPTIPLETKKKIKEEFYKATS